MARPSFSFPFVKPPNMIPNVDETLLWSEFGPDRDECNLPQPQPLWIKNSGGNDQRRLPSASNPAARQSKQPKDKAKKAANTTAPATFQFTDTIIYQSDSFQSQSYSQLSDILSDIIGKNGSAVRSARRREEADEQQSRLLDSDIQVKLPETYNPAATKKGRVPAQKPNRPQINTIAIPGTRPARGVRPDGLAAREIVGAQDSSRSGIASAQEEVAVDSSCSATSQLLREKNLLLTPRSPKSKNNKKQSHAL